MPTSSHNALIRAELRDLGDLPPGERLPRLIDLLVQDIASLPLNADPPPEVREARKAFDAACAWGRQIAAEIEAAEEATKEAAAADVVAAADAFREGKPAPKQLRQTKAAESVTGSIVGAQAAERLVEEAHDHLVGAVLAAWAMWRRALIAGAADAHGVAAEAMAAAAAAVGAARGRYGAVTKLDSELLARHADIKRTVDAETRAGLAWYASTHDVRAPLRSVSIPGHNDRGKPLAVDLAAVVEACADAVEGSVHFSPSDWVPPGDTEHDEMLAEPLDLTMPWVRSAALRLLGPRCALCGASQPPADTVAAEGGRLSMVHARCQRRPPSEQEKRRQARLDKLQRSGYPEPPDGMRSDGSE